MRLIKKLDQFVLGNFITLFMGTFVICLFIVMMQFLWKYVDEIVGKGLSLTVTAKFFFYAGETLVSLALPLAILLASLISFGNMGERLELLALKAAGISLWRIMRPLVVLMIGFTFISFHFQNVIAPNAQNQLYTLMYSIRQKSPEVDIPEGVFYDGVEGMNLFVQHKDKKTGLLHGVIIYYLRDGTNNATILLADSGRLKTSEDKQHLRLRLWSGEQFQNLRDNTLKANNVPYRRETFVQKDFIIDYDQNFELSDADFSFSAKTKNVEKLEVGIDSLTGLIDSTSRAFVTDMKRGTLYVPDAALPKDSPKPAPQKGEAARGAAASAETDIDTVFARMTAGVQSSVLQRALQRVTQADNDMDFRDEIMKQYQKELRQHKIQVWQKITLSLACLIFFFIGAPLGAIIRKGGLGMPVVVAVIIFIFYYMVEKVGENLALAGTIPPVMGLWLSTAVLAPIGIFLTVKSNNDSVVFNMDAYVAFFRKLWGIRVKRHIVRKEVIIHDPDYARDAALLDGIVQDARDYRHTHNLLRFPNYADVYFRNGRDEEIESLSRRLEYCIDDLSNSKVHHILLDLNAFPVIDAHAHTAPFHDRRLNMAAGICFPLGIFLLFRMARFRHRLRRDLKVVIDMGRKVADECRETAAAVSASATDGDSAAS